ncbi:SEL1-like repeat protein [Campylobacter sp. RM12647]|uniref:SEL1-like repeat protein n=1 Tax=Campylobacter sp. RM12647 TaxID=2735737 RepID=UPI00301474E2
MNKTLVKSCHHLGLMYKFGVSVKKDLSKAKKYFKKACDLDPYYGVIFKPCDEYKKIIE